MRTSFVFLRILFRTVTGLIARLYLWLVGVQIGANIRISSLPICRRNKTATICFGANVQILNTLRENLAGIAHKSVFVAACPGARIIVGNNVGMSGVILYAFTEILIDDWVNLGAGVRIYDTDFHCIDAGLRRLHNTANIGTAKVHICEDVFVGAGSMILKGVTIGARAIIGAGSVVAKDIPADAVAVGVPAKVVRFLHSSSRVPRNGERR
jgi:acetyltransferase-like isoleucine patch superfamily enzyme